MRRLILQVGAIVAAAAAALAPISAATVERWFSTGVYPRIQHALTGLSNAVPFAVFDLLLAAALVVVMTILFKGIGRAYRGRALRPLWAALFDLLGLAAAVYLAFVLLWGLNYRRLPMRDRLDVKQGAPSAAAVVALGRQAAAQLNRLYERAHAAGWPADLSRDAELRAAFGGVQRLLADAPLAEPGRLKESLVGPYFRWTGVDGMVNPFALEAIANPDLLPYERPFVAAHEWAHLAGYADESEASFVGWLTCVRADAPAQYSGWLSLYWQVSGEVDAAERASLTAALSEGPRRDIEAVAARMRRGQMPGLRRASWAVYDQYLKAHRVEGGVRSYGVVVSLILQTTFKDGWAPVRREDAGRGQ